VGCLLGFQAQEDEKHQASRREFSVVIDRKTTTTASEDRQVLDRHVSFTTVTARHSREIRVPRETFYEFVDKTIDRFAETSKTSSCVEVRQFLIV